MVLLRVWSVRALKRALDKIPFYFQQVQTPGKSLCLALLVGEPRLGEGLVYCLWVCVIRALLGVLCSFHQTIYSRTATSTIKSQHFNVPGPNSSQ